MALCHPDSGRATHSRGARLLQSANALPKTGDPLAVVQSLPYYHHWFDHGPFLWPNLSTALGGAMVWRHQFHHGLRQGRIASAGIQERLRAVTVPASLYSRWFERGNP